MSYRSALALVLAAALAAPASATNYVVDSPSDAPSMTTGTPDGVLTLREAVRAANTNRAYGDAPAGSGLNDLIQFAPGARNITLEQGALTIADPMTFFSSQSDGPVTISGGGQSRIFFVATTDEVFFLDLILRDGLDFDGGAMRAGPDATVVLSPVTFENNRAYVNGGVLFVDAGATVELYRTTFVTNRALGNTVGTGGGAIYSRGAVLSNPFTGVAFERNFATGTAGSGGAVLVADGGLVRLGFTIDDPAGTLSGLARDGGADIRFDRNSAARAGGAVEVREGGTLDTDGALFVANRAAVNPGNGGAVHITGAGSVSVTGGAMRDNVASGQGGALWNSATGTLAVSGGAYSRNNSRGGGAVYSDGGDTDVFSGVFTRNRALSTFGSGGAFLSDGATFTVTSSVLTDNQAVFTGGAVEVRGGAMTLSRATVGLNTASGDGGGLYISAGGTLSLDQTTVRDNAARDGAGIYQESGTAAVSASALYRNHATSRGGGLFAEGGTMAVGNSTVSANTARRGDGGYADGGAVSLSSATVAENVALAVGGGFASVDAGRRVLLQNTIVADNIGNGAPQQLSGYFASQGHNLVESRAGAGIAGQKPTDLYGVDAGLAPRADNGGPTSTHALLAGSPAIGAGLSSFATDQRGELRGDPDDIGAFAVGSEAPPLAVGDAAVTGLAPVAPNPIRSTARVRFSVSQSEAVSVELYDVMGRRVQSLYAGTPTAETTVDVTIDASGLASGVYVVVMQSATERQTQRVTVAR